MQGSQSPTSTLSPEATTQQVMLVMNNNGMDKEEEKGGLTLEQFTDIVLAQEGIDPGRIANNGGKCLDASRQVILPSVRGSQRLLGEKLKPVVLTPRSVAAPQAACPPPALLTHRLMSQGREEERRRMEEERRRGEEATLRRGDEKRGTGEERPLYESIYSLAGSPGGICPTAPSKSTLDQLHPLQLQLLGVSGAELALNEQIKRQIELALVRNEQVLGSAARPAEPGGSRRRTSKSGPLRIHSSGSGRSQPTAEASCPLNLSIVREDQPLLQLVRKSSSQQCQAMPKEASEALLSLIAKTGRDLEITRKTRKAGEADSSERLLRGNQLQTSRNFNPIAPEVAVTPVFPGRQQKRRLADEEEKEDGGGKKVKKVENENGYRILAKNFRKADEKQQGEMSEMERMVVVGSKQDEKEKLGKGVESSKEVVTTVGREEASPPSPGSQRSPKLLNGSSPTGLIHCTPPQQNPSTDSILPNTTLKQEAGDKFSSQEAGDKLESKEVIREDLRMRAAAMADLKLATAQDINGNCPIHVAVLLGNLRLVHRFAIVLNALNQNVDVANGQGMTALHLAVANGEEAIVDELSRRGADPCKPSSSSGDSAIHLAVKGGHSGCLRMLLKRNPGRREIDHCNDQGLGAVHLAVINGEDSMLKQLLAYGAKPDLQEMTGGKTAMFLAVER